MRDFTWMQSTYLYANRVESEVIQPENNYLRFLYANLTISLHRRFCTRYRPITLAENKFAVGTLDVAHFVGIPVNCRQTRSPTWEIPLAPSCWHCLGKKPKYVPSQRCGRSSNTFAKFQRGLSSRNPIAEPQIFMQICIFTNVSTTSNDISSRKSIKQS